MIRPAIIPRSLSDLKRSLEKVSFSKAVQIDVVDGKFNPNVSWPYEPKGDTREASGLMAGRDVEVEVDLMVFGPVSAGREWLASGASGLVFHLESLDDPEDAVALRKSFDFSLGFSINNDTALETLYPWIDKGDFVQLMGIKEIGAQGQPFDERILERVAILRHLYPDLIISIDGGVNEDTIGQLAAAGADNFAVGSAILKARDPKQKYEELLKIIR